MISHCLCPVWLIKDGHHAWLHISRRTALVPAPGSGPSPHVPLHQSDAAQGMFWEHLGNHWQALILEQACPERRKFLTVIFSKVKIISHHHTLRQFLISQRNGGTFGLAWMVSWAACPLRFGSLLILVLAMPSGCGIFS